MKLRLLVFLVGAGLAGTACAQVAGSYAGLDHINRIIAGTPGVTTAGATGGGVTARASGPVAWSRGGVSVSIPTTVEARVGAGAIARAGGLVVSRVVPWIGAALVIKSIYDLLAPDGIVPCQGTVCKGPSVVSSGVFKPYPDPGVYVGGGTSGTWTRYVELPSVAHGCGGSYPTGFSVRTYVQNPATPCGWAAQGTVVVNLLPDPTPVADPPGTVEQNLLPKIAASPALGKDLYDRMKAMEPLNPDMVPGTSPLDLRSATVTIPGTGPVSSPEMLVSTKTYPNADGSTSTETVKETTTVTPNAAPDATVGNPNISFPSTTTRVTTVVNNVTNVTNITTEKINNPSPPPPAGASEVKIPTDYNREVTQQSILSTLKEAFGPIKAEVPKGDDELKSIKDQNDLGVAAVGNITEASMGFKGWFPSIPTATCVNPTVSSYTGDVREVAICDKVSVFQTFISAVVCVFAVFGCVREVQSALKA